MSYYILIAGTRPEAIKLAPVAAALRRRGARADFCAVGQHGDLLTDTLAAFGEVPRYAPIAFRRGRTPAELLAEMLRVLPPLFTDAAPDGVLVQGDTTAALGGALATFYGKVNKKAARRADGERCASAPSGGVLGTFARAGKTHSAPVPPHRAHIPPALIHVEAGLRTYDMFPFPEEAHRRMIAPLADLHLCPTGADAAALCSERVTGRIAVTGNSGLDGLRLILSRPAPSLPATEGRIVLCTLHRRENADAMPSFLTSLEEIADAVPDCTVLFPTHPSPELTTALGKVRHPRLHILPPLDYPTCAHLLPRLTLLLTDSGGLQEEAAFLGIPTLVLRKQSERGDAPSLRIIGGDPDKMVSEAVGLLSDEAALSQLRIRSYRYGDGFAADRIAEAILGEWA